MLFNSIDFAIFLPIVFGVYWWLSRFNNLFQNAFIVFASYTFYSWWDPRFLALIVISSLVDFVIGLKLRNEERDRIRKYLLGISVSANLIILFVFKYYNFFVDNLSSVLLAFGLSVQFKYLNVLLPIGISFYTFQTLSYTIDVYKRKIEPTSNLFAFLAFVSFFPQLVAGPIERASNLLPQFTTKRSFNYILSIDGLRQMLWGLFKKIVIADRCGIYADLIFNNSSLYSGSTLVLGAMFFSIQIYADLSGYSDIAIGCSKLFGFRLSRNFSFPYFSRDIAEFWRRWHISLSTWFRDYVYIPLGGGRGGTSMKVRNIFLIFILSGFWHGASWTFIIWGVLHAIFYLPLLLTKTNRKHLDTIATEKVLPSLKHVILILKTFMLVSLSWIFLEQIILNMRWIIFLEFAQHHCLKYLTLKV